jgi:hypothetical protein
MKRTGTYVATYAAHYYDSRWTKQGGNYAFDLNMGALIYCDQQRTNGRIGREQALEVCPWLTPKQSDAAIRFLRRHGFWESLRRGEYQIVDYAEHILEAETITKKADADYNRKIRQREHAAGNHDYCGDPQWCPFIRKAHRAGDHSECKAGFCDRATLTVMVAQRPGNAAPTKPVKTQPVPEPEPETEIDWSLDDAEWSKTQRRVFDDEDSNWFVARDDWLMSQPNTDWVDFVNDQITEVPDYGESKQDWGSVYSEDPVRYCEIDVALKAAWFADPDGYPAVKAAAEKAGVSPGLIAYLSEVLLGELETAKKDLAAAQAEKARKEQAAAEKKRRDLEEAAAAEQRRKEAEAAAKRQKELNAAENERNLRELYALSGSDYPDDEKEGRD